MRKPGRVDSGFALSARSGMTLRSMFARSKPRGPRLLRQGGLETRPYMTSICANDPLRKPTGVSFAEAAHKSGGS
jgi:hypothetical protein